MPLLKFKEGYVERMWGGQKLRSVYGKDTPGDSPIGEAWLVADHPQHVSMVADGPYAGQTLRTLLENDPALVLGSRVKLTIHGRFPLLLKFLDAGDKLSIQVHPDDEDAKRLKEPDVGKAEMWYVLQADEDSDLFCGMSPDVTRETFEAAIVNGTVAELLTRFPAREGGAIFVQAGTVHAIGGGCLLAEIQQNSDLTYRVDDWGRLQTDGTPRPLHVEKALEVTHFGSQHGGAVSPLAYDADDAHVSVLTACSYFVAERIELNGSHTCDTRGETFHLLLCVQGQINVQAAEDKATLHSGQTLMVTGSEASYSVSGHATLLHYYVPDLQRDVVQPLLDAGHDRDAIDSLGGDTT